MFRKSYIYMFAYAQMVLNESLWSPLTILVTINETESSCWFKTHGL